MQTPDQSEENQQGFPPLYEFPAGSSPVQSVAEGEQRGEAEQIAPPSVGELNQPSEEEIRQGLVYPPPPSFYQHEAEPVPPEPAPPAPFYPSQHAFPDYREGAAPFQSYQAGTLPPPNYPAGPAPAQRPPVKKSYTWVWIVSIILGVALLTACGLCGTAAYNLYAGTFKSLQGANNTVLDYYNAIQAKRYAEAYSYLAPDGQIAGLTQTQFIQQAQQQDQQYGPVLSYSAGAPSFTTTSGGTDLSRCTVSVDVGRQDRKSSTTFLTLRQIGNSWKITEFSGI